MDYKIISFLFLVIILFISNSRSLYSQSISNNKQIKNNEIIDTNKIYPSFKLTKQPYFPGGIDSLEKFIDSNLKFNSSQLEYEGILCICLTIDRDGEIIDFYIPGDIEPRLFNSTIKKIIEKSPKLTPGEIRGINVKSIICIPIFIKLY